jgi:formiminotetrahydrofolate cyclodeaminase
VTVPEPDFLSLRVESLLDAVAARTPAPGGGSVSALAVALAAGLVEMAARFSEPHWPEARVAAARSALLRERAAELAPADAAAYEAVLAASGAEATARALDAAAEVPLELARVAADVAALAADAVVHGNPNLRGDAATGAALAEAGARAAANLVAINLRARADDGRPARAARYAADAAEAAQRAFAAGG